MTRSASIAVLSVIVAVSAVPAWAGPPPDLAMDQGRSVRTWAFSAAKPGWDEVIFLWTPGQPLGNTEQFLVGECLRLDGSGVPVGNHKVTLDDIVLLGIDTGNMVEATLQKKTMRGGYQTQQAVWLLTTSARALFAQDSAVLVAGRVKVSKRVATWDVLTCAIGVQEILDVGGAQLPIAEQGSLPVVDGLNLPRLLEVPGARAPR